MTERADILMIWSKVRQQLESFLCPALAGSVEYIVSGYRYTADKPIHCNITVDKIEVFNMKDPSTGIKWYQTEQEIKAEIEGKLTVTSEEIETVRKESSHLIPDERLEVIARNHKAARCAKAILKAQTNLVKQDFQKLANIFLSESIENSLESEDIILNVLALVDRRLGKKRLQALASEMQIKHPIVQYFYALRLRS
jgi:hypothetical protein